MKQFLVLFFLISSIASIISIIVLNAISFSPNSNYLVVRKKNGNISISRTKNDIYFCMDHDNNTVVSNLNHSCNLQSDINTKNISTAILKSKYSRTKLQVNLNFAKNLLQAQPNIEVPLVNDIVVSKRNDSWSIYVVINNGNTHNDTFKYYRSVNVTLEIDGVIYHNLYPSGIVYPLRVLKYIVPIMKPIGKLSLFDHSKMIEYKDLPYQALVKQPKRKVAVCAYISNFNTAAEIKSLLAFYLLQKIDNVIFYCSVHCDYFHIILKKEIDIGYVILYEYPWPLTRNYGFYQRSVQGSQINSCYYRHRDYFKYIISQDVDEYFYSELYPYNLFKAINKAYELSPDKLSLPVYFVVYYYVGGIIFVFGKSR